MLNNFFFTVVFFILDHFFIVLIFNVISLIVMKYAYGKWHDKLRAQDVRYMSLIILILLAFLLLLCIMAVIYVVSVFILYFHEIGKYASRWSTMLHYFG
jgi:hypothetical protein